MCTLAGLDRRRVLNRFRTRFRPLHPLRASPRCPSRGATIAAWHNALPPPPGPHRRCPRVGRDTRVRLPAIVGHDHRHRYWSCGHAPRKPTPLPWRVLGLGPLLPGLFTCRHLHRAATLAPSHPSYPRPMQANVANIGYLAHCLSCAASGEGGKLPGGLHRAPTASLASYRPQLQCIATRSSTPGDQAHRPACQPLLHRADPGMANVLLVLAVSRPHLPTLRLEAGGTRLPPRRPASARALLLYPRHHLRLRPRSLLAPRLLLALSSQYLRASL